MFVFLLFFLSKIATDKLNLSKQPVLCGFLLVSKKKLWKIEAANNT